MSTTRSENKIASLVESKNKNLRVMSTLLSEGRENSNEYRALEQAVKDSEEDIAILRKLASHPSIIAAEQKQEQEEREKQAHGIATTVSENVTAAIITSDKGGERRQRQETQLRSYLKYGNLAELRDVAVSVDNGALVPQEFGLVTEATRFTGRIVQEIYKYGNTNGASVKFPVSDDTANGLTLVAETGSTNSAEADPTVFSTTQPGAASLIGRIDYSKQFSDDSVAGYLQRLVGPRVARALSSAVMVGTDSAGTALTGFVPVGGYLSGIPTGTTTSAIANGIGLVDLENLYASLDYSYQNVGSWFMHQKTRDYFQSQKDSAGRSLYGVSPQEGLVNLFSRPVYIDNNLPAPTAGVFAANSTPIIFGDHSRAFGAAISDVVVKVLTERFSDVLLNSLLFYVRFQSAKLVQAASAKLKIAAS